METNIDALTILAEVTTAFVAFSAIVASLRVTLGEEPSEFQRLLIHFFTESGMIIVSVALLPLILAGFWQDEQTVARITTFYTLGVTGLYLPFYFRRRLRIKAPTPIPSAFVMIGYFTWLPMLAFTVAGFSWQPSLAIIAAYCYWGLFSSVLIFSTFLASFVQTPSALLRPLTGQRLS